MSSNPILSSMTDTHLSSTRTNLTIRQEENPPRANRECADNPSSPLHTNKSSRPHSSWTYSQSHSFVVIIPKSTADVHSHSPPAPHYGRELRPRRFRGTSAAQASGLFYGYQKSTSSTARGLCHLGLPPFSWRQVRCLLLPCLLLRPIPK